MAVILSFVREYPMTKCKSYLLIKSKVGGVGTGGTGGGTDTTGVGGVTGTSGAYTNPTSTTESIYSATRTSSLLLGSLPADPPATTTATVSPMPFLMSFSADGSDPKVVKSAFLYRNPCTAQPAALFTLPSDFSRGIAWIGSYGRVDGTMTYDATTEPRTRRLQCQGGSVGMGFGTLNDDSGLTKAGFPTDAFLGVGLMYISTDTPVVTTDTIVLKNGQEFLEPYSYNGKKVYTKYTYFANATPALNMQWATDRHISTLLNQSSGTTYNAGVGTSSIQFSVEGNSGGPTTTVAGTNVVRYVAGNTDKTGTCFFLTTYASDEDAADLSMDLKERDYPVVTDAASYGRNFKTIYAQFTLSRDTNWTTIPNIPKVSTQPIFLWKVGHIVVGTKQYATNVMINFRWNAGEWQVKNTSGTTYGCEATLLIKYY